MTVITGLLRCARNDGRDGGHCEERSDEAIQHRRALCAQRSLSTNDERRTTNGLLACLFMALICIVPSIAVAADFDYSSFAQIPILHEGRIKPLETFAQTQLLTISGKRSEKERSGIEWMAELLFTPSQNYTKPVFRILNPDVLAMLDLEPNESKRYDFVTLYPELRRLEDTAMQIQATEPEQRSPAQQQFFELYHHAMRYYQTSRSLTALLPTIVVQSPEAAEELGLEVGHGYTYLEVRHLEERIAKLVEAIDTDDPKNLSEQDAALAALSFDVHFTKQDSHSHTLRIVPPQWADSDPAWLSPWQVFIQGAGAPEAAGYFKHWQALAQAYITQDADAWQRASEAALSYAQDFNGVDAGNLRLEHQYNSWDLFTKSFALYMLAFLLICIGWIGWERGMQRSAFVLTVVGGLLHTLGLIYRMIIMARPPVSTLYESVIFVGFIAVLFGIILEFVRRDALGLLIATIIGAAMHAVAWGYADDGDTMGQLVAVLNTNFWLATHVVTITIGYGCAVVGGVVAHIYLIARIAKPENNEKHQSLAKNMLGVALFALFFSLFGTILGGIWADQSWGRFWGWDPKENGALWIVLWLLWLLHGRIAGQLKPLGFAAGMVITNIIVALAWFGVNLLNVGLHSYGFTDSIAMNLALFCGGELLFAIFTYGWIRLSK